MDRRTFVRAALWSASAGTLMLESAPTIHIRHGEVKKWRSVKGMEGLEVAMDFLSKPDLASMKEGKYPLEGEEVYALIMKMNTNELTSKNQNPISPTKASNRKPIKNPSNSEAAKPTQVRPSGWCEK